METRQSSAVNPWLHDLCLLFARPRPPGSIVQIAAESRLEPGVNFPYLPQAQHCRPRRSPDYTPNFTLSSPPLGDPRVDFLDGCGTLNSSFPRHHEPNLGYASFRSGYGIPFDVSTNGTFHHSGPVPPPSSIGSLCLRVLDVHGTVVLQRPMTGGDSHNGNSWLNEALQLRDRYTSPSLNSSGTPAGYPTFSLPTTHRTTMSDSSLPAERSTSIDSGAVSHKSPSAKETASFKASNGQITPPGGLHSQKQQQVETNSHLSPKSGPLRRGQCLSHSQPDVAHEELRFSCDEDEFKHGEQDYSHLSGFKPGPEQDSYWKWSRERAILSQE